MSISPPRKLGIDGNAINRWMAPWLTSIHIPYESFGQYAVAQLGALWGGDATHIVSVPHHPPALLESAGG